MFFSILVVEIMKYNYKIEKIDIILQRESVLVKYNIYCYERCHIQYDYNDIMIIGGIICERNKVKKQKSMIYYN